MKPGENYIKIREACKKFKKAEEEFESARQSCKWFGLVYKDTCGSPDKRGLNCNVIVCPFRHKDE